MVNGPGKLPVPLSVRVQDSSPRPAVLEQDIRFLEEVDLPGAETRSTDEKVLGVAYTVRDPMDLTRAGWGVVFAADADPRIQSLLRPLLDWRKSQVQNPALFQVFDGPLRGVSRGLTANSWAFSRGVSLTAPADPRKGVPYYLLLVGSPQEISFEFQALMKMQWAVGRLFFEDVEDYGRYARQVVAYEDAHYRPLQRKNAAVWMPQNPHDDATLLLSSALASDFLDPNNMLGYESQFSVEAFTAEKATKSQLLDILNGKLDEGPPALVFTGSHGAEYPMTDPDQQRRLQGALMTQEWQRGVPISGANQFSAEDVPAAGTLLGTMFFLFACYSGGCPAEDSYSFNADGTARQLTPEALIARLPQALLRAGGLAVISHVDMAFTYSFATDEDTPQPQVIRTPLELLMQGKRAGLAADALTSLWSALSAQVSQGLPRAMGTSAPSPEIARRASLTIARDEARNYLLLGDPAVRLRIEDLA